MPSPSGKPAGPLDGRILAYRSIRWIAAVLLVALIVKLFLFDTILIRTDQMSPTLLDGDRVLVLRFFSEWPMSLINMQTRKIPVIVENSLVFEKPSCLRIMALSGDSVCVSQGRLVVGGVPSTFSSRPTHDEVLPPDYSPRDSMSPFVLPEKGTTVILDSLSSRGARNFFFAASLVRQENPGRFFSVKPELLIDGAAAGSYVLSDFYLYKGRIDSVPAQREFDWFFWDRVRDYLVGSLPGKEVSLSFSLSMNGSKLFRYTFSKSCIFLCADDWQKGFDSRFFGPVLSSSVTGRVLCVLWSFGKGPEGNTYFRLGRLFKIIR